MSAGHTELRPCPFCGGPAELHVREYTDDVANFGDAYADCASAECLAVAWHKTGDAAITAWNTRAIEAAEADLLGKALEAARKAKRELENGNGEVMSIIAAMVHLDAILSQAREVK